MPENVVARWESAYRRYREASKVASSVAGDQTVAREMVAASRDVAALWREMESTADLPWWLLAALSAAAQAFEFQARDWIVQPDYFPPEVTHARRPAVRLTTRAQPTRDEVGESDG